MFDISFGEVILIIGGIIVGMFVLMLLNTFVGGGAFFGTSIVFNEITYALQPLIFGVVVLVVGLVVWAFHSGQVDA